ncbi:MAG: serine hydrolase [Chitinophagaceae bacterium]|nr:serine hydrolase [Chitinophagaceae bacterium]
MRIQGKKIFTTFFIILITSNAFSQTLPDSITKKIDNIFKEWNTSNSPGCVVGVVKNDSLIYVKGFGMADIEHAFPITPTTIFYMASVSKQFTGYSIVLLARQGKINIDEDIHVYLPWATQFGKRITVRNLLNHTSGIRDNGALAAISGLGINGMLTHDLSLNILKRQRSLNFTPGQQYSYSNSNYILLSEIVETVSGKSFRAFVDSAIFKPLGMTHSRFQDDYTELIQNRAFSYRALDSTHYSNNYQNTYTLGDGGLFTNITDMAKWATNYYSPKAGDSKDIIQLTENGKLNSGKQISYALGIESDLYKGWRVFRHSGANAGYRTNISVLPDLKMGFLVFSNVGNFSSVAKTNEVADLFVIDTLRNETISANAATDSSLAILKDITMLKQVEGNYLSDAGLQLKFSIRNGKFYTEAFGQSYLLIQRQKDTFSLFNDPNIQFYFGKNFDKRKSGVIILPNQEPQSIKKYSTNEVFNDTILKAYTGTYFSTELDCSFKIVLKDHQLLLTNNKYNDANLILVGKDNIIDKSEILSHLKILRNTNNKITGFEVNSGRFMHLKFHKIKSL